MKPFMDALYTIVATGRGELPEAPIESTAAGLTLNGSYLVWLAVSVGKKQAAVCEGRGDSIRSAVFDALHLYGRHLRLAPAGQVQIRLDVLCGMRPAVQLTASEKAVAEAARPRQPREGLGFGADLKVAFLAEEVTVWQLKHGEQLDSAQVLNACRRHFGPFLNADFFAHIQRGVPLDHYLFTTIAYLWEEGAFTDLQHPDRYAVHADRLIQAIRLARDYYFKQLVNASGKMVYSFLPGRNLREKRYNILRHSGTAYAMLETHELLPDEELLSAAKKALHYLLDKTEVFSYQGVSCRGVIENDALKLGGNALAIVALAKYTQVTGDRQYLTQMQELAGWIRQVQDDTGRFTVHKHQFSTGKVEDFVSGYYPGEAMLALVRLYQLDRDEQWLDTAEKSARYLITIRDENANTADIVHDHWLLYALNELYRERPEEMYLNHTMLIADAIVGSQITGNQENPEQNGAYRLPHPRPESTPTACRSEGLCAAYRLLRDAGMKEKAAAYRKAIEAGIRFQLQTQMRPENAVFYHKPKFCLGAFQRSLTRDDLRIDFTQHNLSGLIAYARILSEDGPLE